MGDRVTYKPPSTLDAFRCSAVLTSSQVAGPSVTVTSSNKKAVFRVTYANSVAATDLTVEIPEGTYRDANMALQAVDTSFAPLKFTSQDGKPVVLLMGMWSAGGGTFEYAGGTADYLGFLPDVQVPLASPEPTSDVEYLESVAATGGSGGGGGGTVALGGANCWYSSPTSTAVSGNLGYASGDGVAAVSPLFIDQELTFSKFAVEIWTAYTASTDYTAVLYDSADGYPNALLAKATLSTGTSGGGKTADITPITLAPGTYWIGAAIAAVEPATGALVCNTGVGIMMAHSPTGTVKTGNQRIAAGWKTTSLAIGAVGSTWPSRSASGMGTDYRVPRVGLWAS